MEIVEMVKEILECQDKLHESEGFLLRAEVNRNLSVSTLKINLVEEEEIAGFKKDLEKEEALVKELEGLVEYESAYLEWAKLNYEDDCESEGIDPQVEVNRQLTESGSADEFRDVT